MSKIVTLTVVTVHSFEQTGVSNIIVRNVPHMLWRCISECGACDTQWRIHSWYQGGVSESHKSKWLVKVGVSMGVTP